MLKLTGVTKLFFPGTTDEKRVLDGLDLHLAKGEFVTLIGSNGAGKTTLINCISGACRPEAGRVLLDEEDITSQPEHRRAIHIGRVFQDPHKGTAFDMTVAENMSIAYHKGRGKGLAPGITRVERDLFRQGLKRLDMGLEDRLESKVGLLSGGQRQALTLLMATLGRPKLLLLDEHTAALDPAASQKVMELTCVLVAEGQITTMMVTHNMRSALAAGNRTVMMHGGKVILDISGEERRKATVEGLVALFQEKNGDGLLSDRMLLG